jgi:hypothetical protein
MNSPIHTQVTGEIGAADDLLAPLPEAAPRLGGPGPFVINLSASSAPIVPQAMNIAGCEQAHAYQVQRTEDRRIRFRLRLGPFANEDEVDAILEEVRSIYPSALSATADSDDLRVIASLQSRAQTQKSPARRPDAAPAALPTRVAPSVVAAVPVAARATPARIAQSVSAAPVAPTRAAAPLATAQQASPRASSSAPEPVVGRPPSTDAAQTELVLSQAESREELAMGWFVIQLLLAQDALDVDRVKKHDIFKAYRLYTVAGLDQGRVMHSLRLGFFKEESAAQAVASYLAAFYDNPTVKRVSAAERNRFADRRVDPRRDAGPGAPATIEITGERFVRAKTR